MSKETIEKLVMIMDMNGYEQDGDGPCFIGMGGKKNKCFMSWGEVYDFVLKNFYHK